MLALHGYLFALTAGRNWWVVMAVGVLLLIVASVHAMPPVDFRSLTGAGEALGWTESRARSVARGIQVLTALLVLSVVVALLL